MLKSSLTTTIGSSTTTLQYSTSATIDENNSSTIFGLSTTGLSSTSMVYEPTFQPTIFDAHQVNQTMSYIESMNDDELSSILDQIEFQEQDDNYIKPKDKQYTKKL